MKTIRPFFVFLWLVTLTFVGCNSIAVDAEVAVIQSQQIVGTWTRKDVQVKQSITFNSNGTFSEDDMIGDAQVLANGNYTVSDGSIILVLANNGKSIELFDCIIKGSRLYTSQIHPSGATLRVYWSKS